MVEQSGSRTYYLPTNDSPSIVVYVGGTTAGAVAAVRAAVVSSFNVK